ncbi:MAG TPA: metallophosphoesterase [Clostridia bacterium]|nr:metallophosphoesterase [Clostridia bacterium]
MIYVTGDMHGDIKRFKQTQLKKLKKGDTLIICGDFGFLWDDSKKEKRLLKKIGRKKYNVCFIDGTHENFKLLNAYEVSEWNKGKVHNICGKLYHLMRGQMYEIEGQKVFTMGGGESPDIDIRFDNNTWSSSEIPSRKELLEGASTLEKANGKVDLIITHEPPLKIKGFLNLKDKKNIRVSGLNSYFEEISNQCEFKRWFFGSLHVDKYISSSHIGVFRKIVDAQTGKPLK